ncbi:Ferric siderophore transport system, periplasmic binding protein TonB [hydrothermal vent metagenome]|uniref:Ferric siderophore transport system, periplasmic binding protein TonB n=1 Tax=hydrothermal vent metagenome TaxID=652676 RepID=A0A3B1A5P4_9ZZZZ
MYKYASEPLLPWSDTDNDQRFNKIARIVFIVFFILFIVFPFLPQSEVKKDKFEDVPPRFARLLIKQPIKPIIKKPEPKKIEKKKKKEVKKKPKKKIKKKTPKKKTNKPKPKPKPKPSAKKIAQSVFELAGFDDELADLRDGFDVATLKKSKLKTISKRKKTAFDASSILTSKAGSGSGGIKNQKVSINTKSKLQQRDTTNVRSTIKTTGDKTRKVRPTGRSDEEIQLVFQRNKGKLNSIYNRTLRKDPSLQGTILFKITINAAGKVIFIKIISTEIKNKKLNTRIRLRIKRFNFGAKPGAANFTFNYPLDLIPQ